MISPSWLEKRERDKNDWGMKNNLMEMRDDSHSLLSFSIVMRLSFEYPPSSTLWRFGINLIHISSTSHPSPHPLLLFLLFHLHHHPHLILITSPHPSSPPPTPPSLSISHPSSPPLVFQEWRKIGEKKGMRGMMKEWPHPLQNNNNVTSC